MRAGPVARSPSPERTTKKRGLLSGFISGLVCRGGACRALLSNCEQKLAKLFLPPRSFLNARYFFCLSAHVVYFGREQGLRAVTANAHFESKNNAISG